MLKNIRKVKGSTIIITFMYVTWVVYIIALVGIHLITGEWLPSEVTFATAALFIVETVSLAKLKMAKEGTHIPEKKSNPLLEQIGLTDMPDFEEEIQEVVEGKHARKDEDVCE